MNDDKLADVFGMRTMQEVVDEDGVVHEVPVVQGEIVNVEEQVIDSALQDAADDFADVRNKIKDMLEKSAEVFEAAHFTATTSQNAKDIEAFARVLDSITKSSKELMTMHKDMYNFKPVIEEKPQQQADTINNIVFTGSSTDFIEFLKSKTQGAITDQSNE